PGSWAVHVDKWIPFNAGGAIWENLSGTSMFSPWVGFGVFCAYAAIAVVAGRGLFRPRGGARQPGAPGGDPGDGRPAPVGCGGAGGGGREPAGAGAAPGPPVTVRTGSGGTRR